MTQWNILIGTYTRDTQSSGIYHSHSIGEAVCVADADNPSYLAMRRGGSTVYCVNEVDDFQAASDASDPTNTDTINVSQTGAVSSYRITQAAAEKSISLKFNSKIESMGADPCHISIHQDGQFLVASNYSGGTFATLPITEDGDLESFVSLTQHSGDGPNLERQTSAHVHSSLFSANTIFIADLGADRVVQYPVTEQGEIGLEGQHTIVAEPGSGPRYMATTDTDLLVLNELNNTLCRYRLSDLTLQQTISVVPDAETTSIAAHLVVSQDKQFAYVSNRGFDTIAVFRLHPELELIQSIATGGQHPRHFALLGENEPLLLVANMDSDNIIGFDRDSTTGLLAPTSIEISVPAPVCLLPVG